MPRKKEYSSVAERQKAYRQRKAQRANLPQLPEVIFMQHKRAALEALSAIEQLQRTNGSKDQTILSTILIQTKIETLKM